MDLTDYRNSTSEQARISDLMRLAPATGRTALDIGARDGYLSKLLAERFKSVTALDLQMPVIDHPRIACVQGDITALQFPDAGFDLVLCAEVLEHIPPPHLAKACRELARVSGKYVLIGVPYKQDTRLGRTTCVSCGGTNPPWGHVNTFDEHRLAALFPGFVATTQSFVGTSAESTNAVSSWLMNLAGNPYGTYVQEEPCIHCNAALLGPPERQLWQKMATRLAFIGMRIQKPFIKPHGNWIHLLLTRQTP
jgi:cyclopropane fatty-acyl-phospholipid synthase-like methyltransferase